jgi:hypothetical protein
VAIVFKDLQKLVSSHSQQQNIPCALTTAVDNDGTLDKEATSYNDVFDAFRLAVKFYHFEEMIG